MTSARRLYRLQLAFGSVGLGAATVGALAALGAVNLTMPSPQALAAACGRWVPALTIAEWLLLGLGVLAFAVGALGLRSLVCQLRRALRYRRDFAPRCGPVEVAGKQCWIVEDPEPQAFCSGLLCPRIYLSRGALELLPEDELEAVVAHEAYHAKRRDPLRFFVARTLADALFLLPALRRMSERYAALSEVAADQAAVQVTSGSSALASALLRFDEHAEDTPALVGISGERVDALAGEADAGRWQIPGRVLAASTGAIGVFLATGLIVHRSSEATISLPLLAAQSCMLLMAAAPVAAALLAISLVRRVSRA
jgi:Zn-dependent protease with chaperone function